MFRKSSAKPLAVHVPLLVRDFLPRAALHHADHEAVVDGERRFTYAEFAGRCYQLAHALRELGLQKGDRLGLVSPNSHAVLEVFQAAAWLGIVVVPLNYRLAAADFAWCLEHSRASAVVADVELTEALQEFPGHRVAARPHHPEHALPGGWTDYEQLLELQPSTPPERPELAEDDLVSVNYTSGTTARPKGVMLTNRNFYVNAYNYVTHFRVRRDDRYLWTLPMFHCNGWGGVYALTSVAATHVIVRAPAPEAVWATVERERITLACMAPVVLGNLLNHPDRRRSLTRVVCAGAPPPAAYIQRAEQELGWEFIQIYGLTETSPIITVGQPGDPREQARAGKAALNAELRVVAPDGREVPADDRSVGEVLARGNMVFAGYWNAPDESARALRDGWFYTGDLATMRADGSIQLVDRAKDVIISGGENISSIEVEEVLHAHPTVVECAVVGIPHDQWGETPLAVVVVREPVEGAVLRDWLRARLAHFKVPSRYEFVEALPRTATGKVQKYALREPHWSGLERRVH